MPTYSCPEGPVPQYMQLPVQVRSQTRVSGSNVHIIVNITARSCATTCAAFMIIYHMMTLMMSYAVHDI